MKRHVMTARRKAALRKAQLSSARKRRRRVAAGLALIGAGAFAYKSGRRYNEARQFYKAVHQEKYSYRDHVRAQSRRRREARRGFYRAVPRILRNDPIVGNIKKAGLKNPYMHIIDSKDSRKLKAKLAYRSLKAGYRNYYN